MTVFFSSVYLRKCITCALVNLNDWALFIKVEDLDGQFWKSFSLGHKAFKETL